MPVYIINNMSIHDLGESKTYAKVFVRTIQPFGGKGLPAQNSPTPIEGRWPFDRTGLLEFPTRELAEQSANSAEYQANAVHRKAGTTSNMVVLEGMG